MSNLEELRKKATEDATLIPHRGKPGTFVPQIGRPQRKAGFYLIDGIDLPSVTTILNIVAKPALVKWAAKQAAKAIFSDPVKYDTPEAAVSALHEIKDEAAERGKEAHVIAEDYAKAIARGTVADVADFKSDNPYFPAIKAFFAQMNPEIIAVEVVLFNKTEGYAGTADLLARIGGKFTVIDWKTSKYVYETHELQLSAYANAEEGILEDETRFVLEKPELQAVVLLRDNGTFVWNPVDADFEAFKAARTLWLWQRSRRGDWD